MFERIQVIKEVNGNNNIIINGNVTADNEVLTKVANHLLSAELSKLTTEAKEKMNVAIKECAQTIMKRISCDQLQSKLAEFSNPSTQFAFYSALKGYSISETAEQREMLVDTFIDRIMTNWDSTEKMILDSALDVLPKLSPQTLSTIGLLQLRHQMVNAQFGFMLNHFFCSLTPLAEEMSKFNTIDVEYLKQEKIILPLTGIQEIVSLEKYMLAHYDLFFRNPLQKGIYENYCKEYPEAHESVTNEPAGTCMMWIDREHNNATSFCCVNSNVFYDQLKHRHQEYIIPHVEALKQMMPAYTEEEVRRYFIKISPSWEQIFHLFSSEVFTRNVLSITGKYIGGKVLAKVSNGTALSLKDYKNRI